MALSSTKQTKVTLSGRRSAPRLLVALVFLIVSLLLLVAFVDYDPSQSHLVTTAFSKQTHSGHLSKLNLVGKVGASLVFYSLFYFGCSSWLLPPFFFVVAYKYCFRLAHVVQWWKYALMGMTLTGSCGLCSLLQRYVIEQPFQSNYFPRGLGGIIGSIVFDELLYPNIGIFGSSMVLAVVFLTGAIFVFIPSESPLDHLGDQLKAFGRNCSVLKSCLLKNIRAVRLPQPIQLLGWARNRLATLMPKRQPAPAFQGAEGATAQAFELPEVQERPSTKPNSFTPQLSCSTALPASPTLEKLSPLPEAEEAPLSTLRSGSSFKLPGKPLPEDDRTLVKTPTFTSELPVGRGDPVYSEAAPSVKIVAEEKVEKADGQFLQKKAGYFFPTLDLLQEPPPIPVADQEEYTTTAMTLVATLKEFGIEVVPGEVHKGPVITRYEVKPASGVRVEKIASLDKNIAMALKAISVRILAPVPGKGCVGIELPNKNPLPVCLREIIESKAWATANAQIPIVLGKEVTGKPLVADLTQMPHLLIAGSTGSGKTVCINTIIASLLYHATPEDLRFIMVDPKIVEMQTYNDLPHMLIPVVTEPKKVPNALKWLIAEMENRYQIFAKVGARNIMSYNTKVAAKLVPAEEGLEGPKKLPYIVCIIDELADLMMVAPADIETSIARLAQLARAAGIHLIIATQRPSVNVITGVIKANLPCRIAFKVASKVDSRTILDGSGADQLIGRGDMLFMGPGTSDLVRVQGAFVSDKEILEIVEAVKRNGPPEIAKDVQERIEFGEEESEPALEGEEKLLQQALEVLKTTQRPSASMLQRRLRIGYNRAARIMETLEERGYLTPSSRGANNADL